MRTPILALLALGLAVTACGSDDSGDSDDAETSSGDEVAVAEVEPGTAQVTIDEEVAEGDATCGDDPAVVVAGSTFTISFSSGSIDTDSEIVLTDADGNRSVSDPSSHEVLIEGIPASGSFAGELDDGSSVEVVFACE